MPHIQHYKTVQPSNKCFPNQRGNVIWIALIALLILQCATMLAVLGNSSSTDPPNRQIVDECLRNYQSNPKLFLPENGECAANPVSINNKV